MPVTNGIATNQRHQRRAENVDTVGVTGSIQYRPPLQVPDLRTSSRSAGGACQIRATQPRNNRKGARTMGKSVQDAGVITAAELEPVRQAAYDDGYDDGRASVIEVCCLPCATWASWPRHFRSPSGRSTR